jgi:hypothetical protein
VLKESRPKVRGSIVMVTAERFPEFPYCCTCVSRLYHLSVGLGGNIDNYQFEQYCNQKLRELSHHQ